ncbi:MAG: hypothetical protein OEN22_04040 [Gammaproteobacteria bacterium]|nr:hypothetical protein [Gammaproteobacteria bacterium]
MKNTSRLPALLLPFLLGACSISATNPTATAAAPGLTATNVVHAQTHRTMLLVSLEDGSVIKQTIDGHADVCFKQISDSATTCLTQGDAIIDPATNAVIGYEMIEDHIDLVARTD